MKRQRRASHQLFVETQMGIVTRYGDWFHTTRKQIGEYVPGLLEKVELQQVVKAAQGWVKSADSLSMILILLLLFITGPLIAAGITLLFHSVWYYNKSTFVSIFLNSFFNLLYKDGVQLVVSLIALSYLGIMGNYFATGTGLFFFFILKPGLLRKVWDKIYETANKSALSLNDRVMKMIILKFSIYEDIPPEDIRLMEERIKKLATSRKKNNKL